MGVYFFVEQLDGKVVPCGANAIVLRNLTINDEHNFLLNVTTNKGETSSSTYSWFIGDHTHSLLFE